MFNKSFFGNYFLDSYFASGEDVVVTSSEPKLSDFVFGKILCDMTVDELSVSSVLGLAATDACDLDPCEKNPCPYNDRRMPCAWIKIINKPMETPTGNWSDYNEFYKGQKWLKLNSEHDNAFMCKDDVPERADPADFPDLES